MRRMMGAAIGLLGLIFPACGPLLDLRDSLTPERPGSYRLGGEIKRDLWGRSYVEPYRRPAHPFDAPSQEQLAKASPPAPKPQPVPQQ